MLIRNGKAFTRGMILLISFIVVFIIFFLPVFPGNGGGSEKTNGMMFADNLFNSLSKGSANFFDATLKNEESVDVRATTVKGKSIDIDVPFKDPALQATAAQVLRKHGLEASENAGDLHVKGDLYALLSGSIADSRSMYDNNAGEVAQRYGLPDGKQVMKAWWSLLSGMVKPMQKIGMVDEASAVVTINAKAVEPSYNFYGITRLAVKDNIPLVAGFLIFYVLYTMWYGFAIFELFEGIGLSMKKGAKSEV